MVDDVAEVMLMESLEPVSKLSDFIAASQIEEAPGSFVTSAEMYAAVNKTSGSCSMPPRPSSAPLRAREAIWLPLRLMTYIEELAQVVWMTGQSL